MATYPKTPGSVSIAAPKTRTPPAPKLGWWWWVAVTSSHEASHVVSVTVITCRP